MNTTSNFTSKMLSSISKYQMTASGMRLLVGVSGGQDSVALLHAIQSVRNILSCEIVAAHINHSFRGEESDGDEEFVRELCESIGIEFKSQKIDVPSLKKRLHLSSQEAARAARHSALRHIAEELQAERILIAHTRDDSIETMLHNIFRGTGLKGLQGLPPVNFPLIRPLIEHSRADTKSYCDENNLKPRVDSSNTKLDYLRNRTRSELLPYLRTYYNQGADDALLRLSKIAGEESDYLERTADTILSEIRYPGKADEIVIPIDKYMESDVCIRRRIIRAAILELRGSLVDISADICNQFAEIPPDKKNCHRMLPFIHDRQITIERNESSIRFFFNPPCAAVVPWYYALESTGVYSIPEAGCKIIVDSCATFEEAVHKSKLNEYSAIFDRKDISLPFEVRSWQSGDRIRPVGLNGTKKIQDIFTDQKIPRSERLNIPIIIESRNNKVLMAGTLAFNELAKRPDISLDKIQSNSTYVILGICSDSSEFML